MKKYLDELKRLSEIEKQVNPGRMVTVELPDGTEKKMKPLEFWPQRDKFIFRDERGVTHYRARVEGLSPELFSLLLIEDEARREDQEDEDEKRVMLNLLTIFFGKAIATKIMEMKGE